MATQNPQMPPGTWVQYNPGPDSPRAPGASLSEQTIGIVRQSFTKGDGTYYQVVWNPGEHNPASGLYHTNELTAVNQQQAQKILGQLSAGTYQPTTTNKQSSQYVQPAIPTIALPPSLQSDGTFASTPGQTPAVTQTS